MNSSISDRELLNKLHHLRRNAPSDFAQRVMDALPLEPDVPVHRSLRQVWPEGGRWFLPALAGAAAAMLLATFAFRGPLPASAGSITVHFEIHAPDAETVELVGTFTAWRAGQLRLEGPDASGHWTASVELPEGRHEYGFLVDGARWVADPRAEVRRDDGFGRENAVIEL